MPHLHSSGNVPALSWCLAATLVMAAQWSAAADSVGNPEAPRNPGVLQFELPAQPLSLSLAAFGRITGYSVLVSSNVTAGKQAAAVSGDLAPAEALVRLLTGTQLAASYIGSRAFTLVPVLPEALAAGSPADNREAEAAAGVQALYAPVLQASITRQLCSKQPKIFGRYRVGVQLWVDTRGAVRRVHLLGSSGTPARDAAVAAHLGTLVMDSAPPAELDQPLTVVLTPRPDPEADCRPFNAVAERR